MRSFLPAIVYFLFLAPLTGFSQEADPMQRFLDSLRMDSILQSQEGKNKQFTTATFKTTRNINLHTLEVVGKRSLDYRISHRFADIRSGANNAWGFDGPATLYMSLEYSHDGRLMFGIGRTSLDKLSEAFLKYRLLRQTQDGNMPLSITLFTSANYTALIDPNKAATGIDKYYYFWDRFSYAHQLLIGRKFSKRLSLEVVPAMVHYNIVDLVSDKNDMFALGFAGRYKITSRMSISGEYVLRLNRYSENFDSYYDAAGIGIDIETGGHVFQIQITNAQGMNEVQFVPYTSGSLAEGLRFGFNLSRVFTLPPRKNKSTKA